MPESFLRVVSIGGSENICRKSDVLAGLQQWSSVAARPDTRPGDDPILNIVGVSDTFTFCYETGWAGKKFEVCNLW